MSILSATECTVYSSISCTAGTVTTKNLIPVVQARINLITNNYFKTDLNVIDTMTFNATARTIVASGNAFDDRNFLANDDIYVMNSYRNDGYFTVSTVSDTTLTLATGASVVDELSGQTIMISVVNWPLDVKVIAAKMCAYDYDVRDSVSANIKSRSLGPLSETFTDGAQDEFGYPKKLTELLSKYTIARLM